MRRLIPACLRALAAIGLLFVGIGCDQSIGPDDEVLKIGVLASSSGFSQRWGETTWACAKATANYWNQNGGFEIDGRAYRIELVRADYASDPQNAMRLVSDMIHEDGIRYMLGPLSDGVAVEVAPLLDAAGVAFVHYGFVPELVREESLGILGIPVPLQTLPVIYEYLSETKAVETICVLATNEVESLGQKLLAESIARSQGIEPLRYSTFDVREENFDASLPGAQLIRRFEGLVRAKPDAVLLCGLGPEEVPQALFYIRQVGFTGPVVALNTQEPALFREMEELTEGLIFVGGYLQGDARSAYYDSLQLELMKEMVEWPIEADVKLYALDSLLRLIRHAGREAVHNPEVLRKTLDAPFKEQDPFFETSRPLRFIGEEIFSANRQISIPILLSEFSEGNVRTVFHSELVN